MVIFFHDYCFFIWNFLYFLIYYKSMFSWSSSQIEVLPIALVVVIALSVIIPYLTRNKSELIRRIPLIVIASIMLILEVVKQIYNIVIGYNLWTLPFHFCSLFLYFYPLASFFKGKTAEFGKTMSFVCGTLFLLLFYIDPTSIIGNSCDEIFATFSSFHTFTYHHLIILFYLILLISKLYHPSKFFFLYGAIGIAIYGIVAVPLAHILNVNFCNILHNSIAILENIRLAYGQVLYTFVMLFLGFAGAELSVGASYLVSFFIKRRRKDNFQKIMKILKEEV